MKIQNTQLDLWVDCVASFHKNGAGPHAVTSVSGTTLPTYCPLGHNANTFAYDANGNMTTRGVDTLAYDSENRLKQIDTHEGTEATQAYTLAEGWNVISFPYLPKNSSVINVLGTLGGLTFGTDYTQVSMWDAASGTWKHFVNDADFNDFTQFEFGKTYEIYVTKSGGASLSVTGVSPAVDITHSLVSGDNFISPSVTTATNITTVLSGLTQGTDFSDVKRFNATTDTWESYTGGAFTQFEPGRGYNIIGLRSATFECGGAAAVTTTFVYDSTGSRVKKTAGSSTTIYLGKDYDIEGSLTTKYIFLGDRRISLKNSSGTLLFFHEDHINSSNVITDSNGNQVALYEYDPYGDTVTHTGSADVKHQFTGQEKDDSSKLYNYGARYYDPQLGRFITADPTVQHPADPQDLNRYAYARNNPIRFTDPTGLGWLSKLFAIIFAVVSLVFTAGQSAWIIIGIAMLAGAAGGLAGAAIEKSNLARGAIEGAVIGAAVGAGAAYGAEAGAGGGGGGSGAGGSSLSASEKSLIQELAQRMADYEYGLSSGAAQVEGAAQTVAIAAPATVSGGGGAAAIGSAALLVLASADPDPGSISSGKSVSQGVDLGSVAFDAVMRGPHPNLLSNGNSGGSGLTPPSAGGEFVSVAAPALFVQQSMVSSTPPVLQNVNRGRSIGEKIKDFIKNPFNWGKTGQRMDPKQPPNGFSIRETWRNKITGEMLERHILERDGDAAKNHPHFHEPK